MNCFLSVYSYLCPTEALAELMDLCFSSLSFPSMQNWPTRPLKLENLNENKEILFVYSSIRYNQYWPADVQTNTEHLPNLASMRMRQCCVYCVKLTLIRPLHSDWTNVTWSSMEASSLDASLVDNAKLYRLTWGTPYREREREGGKNKTTQNKATGTGHTLHISAIAMKWGHHGRQRVTDRLPFVWRGR